MLYYDCEVMCGTLCVTSHVYNTQTSMSVRMGRMVAMLMPSVRTLRETSPACVGSGSLETGSAVQVSK